jgi:hypothetical protein
MMNPDTTRHVRLRRGILTLAACLASLSAISDDTPQPRNFGVSDGTVPEDPREFMHGRYADLPDWQVGKDLPNDVFTFARLRFNSSYYRSSRFRGGKWLTDYPDADVNFCFRLQQLTSMQVNPKGAIVDFNPEQLRHFPFVYMLEVGDIAITDGEARILRDYMMNGGFVMVDDNWGSEEWVNWLHAFKQIFPDREMKELPLEHEIFNIVFKLDRIPQIPSVGHFMNGWTYEREKPDSEGAHYYGVHDDRGRMVMLVCHNTDLGDGWEEEGTDPGYFRTYSEKFAYPLGINIIFYAMTH